VPTLLQHGEQMRFDQFGQRGVLFLQWPSKRFGVGGPS
jgi:hypothetical protein